MSNILCFSRSYLAHLMPRFQDIDLDNNYLFIVQTDEEESVVLQLGGKVVFNVQAYLRDCFKKKDIEKWKEPDDFREITEFYFSPVYSDRYLIHFESKIRSEIAGTLYRGVKALFERLTIDFLIGEPVAIFPTHLLFYLTKKNNGLVRLWGSTFFPKHFYFSDKVTISNPVPRHVLKSKVELENLKLELKDYLEGIKEDKRGPAYHVKFAKKKKSILYTYFNARKGNTPLFIRPGFMSIVLQTGRVLRAKYHKIRFPKGGDYMIAGSIAEHRFYLSCLLTRKVIYNKVPHNYSKRSIFFPIQYEPEASLLYFAPDFCDQYTVVENIAKSIPDDVILYVKEHPNQFGYLGQKKWLWLRKKYHNIKFIYGRESGRDLIKNTNLVVCISSSAGMDGLIFGKRVILVGDVYYQKFTGTKKVHSFNELNRELNDKENYNYKGHEISDLIKDFEVLMKHSHIGFPYSGPTLYKHENLQNISSAIKCEFKR